MELNVRELNEAVGLDHLRWGLRVTHRGLRVEDLLDPFGGSGGAGDHDEDHRGHHHREENQHHVLEEGRQVADLHSARIDAKAAEPDHCNRRQVHDPEEERNHDCEQAVHAQLGVGQIVVRIVEPVLLVVGSHKRPDNSNAAQGLAHDLIDTVRLLLHGPEHRQGPKRHGGDHDNDERDHDNQDCRKRDVLAEGHDDAADHHDRGHDHDVESHDQDHLHLLHVVGIAGDQRRRAEDVGLLLREAHDLPKDCTAHVPTEGHSDLGAEVHGYDGADTEQERHQEHVGTGSDDVPGISLGHAVVDDVCVETRQVEIGEGLDSHEHQHDQQLDSVRPQISR